MLKFTKTDGGNYITTTDCGYDVSIEKAEAGHWMLSIMDWDFDQALFEHGDTKRELVEMANTWNGENRT
jgi:hypothetical protein